MKRICAALLTGLFLLLTACQPTPEKDIIINKGDGALEAAIAATAVPSEQPLLPVDEVGERIEHWTDELTIRGLTCTIDADIVLPDKKVFPVYRVQQRALDAETAAQVLDYFLADATGACETTDTREEVLLDLMAARKGHFVNYPDSMDGTWQPYDGQEEDIARLERALQTVGDDEPFGPVPDTVPLDTPYTYALPDGKRFRIRVSERELTARAYFPRGFEQAESMVMDGEAYPGEPAGTTLQNVKISQEEAEAAAEAFLEHAGLAYLGLAEAEKARILLGEDNTAEEPKTRKRTKAQKPPKAKTHEVSYNMFKEGMTVAQIAAERGLTAGTVFGHLARYAADGLIDIGQLIPQEHIDELRRYMLEHPGASSLGEIKAAVSPQITYDEIRFVVNAGAGK